MTDQDVESQQTAVPQQSPAAADTPTGTKGETAGTTAKAEATGLARFTKPQVRLIFLGLATAVFLATLDATVVSTILQTIVSDLHGSSTDYTWIVASFLLANSAVLPLYGKLSDIFGRREMLLAAMTIFFIGSALCGAATTPTFLIGARAIQGMGAGGLMPMVITVISDITTFEERPKYQGIIGAVFGLSSVIGPLIGGGLTDGISWRYAFYLNLPFTLISMAIVGLYLKLDHKTASFKEQVRRIDLLGSLIAIGAVAALVLATTWGGSQYAWNSKEVIACLVASAVLFAVFIFVEMKIAVEPNIDPRLFKFWNFNAAVFSGFGLGGATFSAIYFIPLYHETLYGNSPTIAGLKLIPLMVGMVGCVIASGRYVSKTGDYVTPPRIGAVLTPLGLGLLTLLGKTENYGIEVPVEILTGAGFGLTVQAGVIASQSELPRELFATGNSALIFVRFIAGSIALAIYFNIFGTYISNHFQYGVTNLVDVQVDAFKQVYFVSLAFAFIALIGNFLFRIPNNPEAKGKSPAAAVAME